VSQRGLLVTDYTGFSAKLLPERVSFSTDARRLADCDVVLVAVKLGAAENVASVLAGTRLPAPPRPCSAMRAHNRIDVLRESPKQPVVVSLQNGVRGAALLRAVRQQYSSARARPRSPRVRAHRSNSPISRCSVAWWR
jgi:ketopantoate reductase